MSDAGTIPIRCIPSVSTHIYLERLVGSVGGALAVKIRDHQNWHGERRPLLRPALLENQLLRTAGGKGIRTTKGKPLSYKSYASALPLHECIKVACKHNMSCGHLFIELYPLLGNCT